MKYHIVQINEKIKDISDKYNVSVEEIIKLNRHINNIENVVPGMKIRIPVLSDEVSDQLKDNFLDIEKYYPKMEDFKEAKVEKKDSDMYSNKEEFSENTDNDVAVNGTPQQVSPAQQQSYVNPYQYYPYYPQYNYYQQQAYPGYNYAVPQQPVYPQVKPNVLPQQYQYPQQNAAGQQVYPDYRQQNIVQETQYQQNPYQYQNYYSPKAETAEKPVVKENVQEIPVIIDEQKEKAEVKPLNPLYSPFLFSQPATCDPGLLDLCDDKSPVYQPYTNYFQNPLYTPPYPCNKAEDNDEFNFSFASCQPETIQKEIKITAVKEYDDSVKEIKADLRDFVKKHTKIQKKKDFTDLL